MSVVGWSSKTGMNSPFLPGSSRGRPAEKVPSGTIQSFLSPPQFPPPSSRARAVWIFILDAKDWLDRRSPTAMKRVRVRVRVSVRIRLMVRVRVRVRERVQIWAGALHQI